MEAWSAGSGFPDLGLRRIENAVTNTVNNTLTVIPLNTNQFTTAGMWGAGNPSRMVAIAAGKYHVGGGIGFSSNAVGYRRIGIRKNGGTIIAAFTAPAIAINPYEMAISCIDLANINDYYELFAMQTSGGALGVDGTIGERCSVGFLQRVS